MPNEANRDSRARRVEVFMAVSLAGEPGRSRRRQLPAALLVGLEDARRLRTGFIGKA